MDENPRTRAAKGVTVSRNGSGRVLRDTADTKDRNAQLCDKIGCPGRLDIKGNQIGCSEKAKTLRHSARSSTTKEIIGSSSGRCSSLNKPRRLSPVSRKKPCPNIETALSATSNILEEPKASEFICSGRIQKRIQPEHRNPESKRAAGLEVGSSRSALNTRSRRNTHKQPEVTNQDIPSASKSTLSKRKEEVRKKTSSGESSSFIKGKKICGLSSDRPVPSSGLNICISEPRQARNSPSRENNSVSASSRRSFSSSRARLSNQGHANRILTNESPVRNRRVPQTGVPINMNSHVTSRQFSTETSSATSSHSQPNTGNLHSTMSIGSVENGINRSAINRDSFRRYNIDGIAEVLLELERIEHEEELSYEQMLVMDSYLFLNGLNFYDQHRDMRLDIDNMSYEELLALEERIGTVSTALSEEALSKCLKRSIYRPTYVEDETCCAGSRDDIICSICQEEYVSGDEVGILQCKHKYHIACIQQWLRLKNWCPICKTSAELST